MMRKVCANCAESPEFDSSCMATCPTLKCKVAYDDTCRHFRYSLYMKYFTIKELCASEMAKKYHIDNTPDSGHERNLRLLVVRVLDPLREVYGKPIYVNSGYRCERLNALVGGVPTSDHVKGRAADITVHSREGNMKIFNLIQSLGLPFDQLIDEKDYTWLHVSYRETGNRKQILHL